MKRKILYSMMLAVLVTLGASKPGRACGYTGPVTCNTFLGTACDGQCQDDVCPGGQTVSEYACSDGSILYQ
jgi:hypothetical protein